MLVILSDLHLTDGTTTRTVAPGAFELFAERLADLAVRASYRQDGRYRPVEQIDLLLLGDILDLMDSAQWYASETRPWTGVESEAGAATVGSIVEGCLQNNQPSLCALRRIASGAATRVPSTGAGDAPSVEVPVRIFYMVGDRDWPLHLAGSDYDTLRQRVAEQLGLANLAVAPFPHDPGESRELLDLLRRHRVLARHGDIFDPLHSDEACDEGSVGDALVIDWLGRFRQSVLRHLADDLPPAVLAGLDGLMHVRPPLLAPVWLAGLLDTGNVRPSVRKQIKGLWDGCADSFLELPVVRQWADGGRQSRVDGLARLTFGRRPPAGWARDILEWLDALRGARGPSYRLHALREPDFRNRRARHVVYGHTHVAEMVPLDASHADGYVLNQVYFNAGTWCRVYQATAWAEAEHDFIAADSFNFLTFYHGDERGGRPFETWTGVLGAGRGEAPVHRIDPRPADHATQQSLPASRVPVRPPHFASTVAPTRRPRAPGS